MKKIIISIFSIFCLLVIANESQAGTKMSIRRDGGVESITIVGGHYDIDCGDLSRLCYKYLDNGDLILGKPCSVWYPTDPDDEEIGVGFMDVTFMGHPTPEDSYSGIMFETNPTSSQTTDYTTWLNY